jgi:hypothetical protein
LLSGEPEHSPPRLPCAAGSAETSPGTAPTITYIDATNFTPYEHRPYVVLADSGTGWCRMMQSPKCRAG